MILAFVLKLFDALGDTVTVVINQFLEATNDDPNSSRMGKTPMLYYGLGDSSRMGSRGSQSRGGT